MELAWEPGLPEKRRFQFRFGLPFTNFNPIVLSFVGAGAGTMGEVDPLPFCSYNVSMHLMFAGFFRPDHDPPMLARPVASVYPTL